MQLIFIDLAEDVHSKLLFSISKGVSAVQSPTPNKDQSKRHSAPTVTLSGASGKIERLVSN